MSESLRHKELKEQAVRKLLEIFDKDEIRKEQWVSYEWEGKTWRNRIDVIGDNDITRDGILNEYYDDGDLKIEYSFENGKKHGLQKRWYNNNQLEIIYNYDMGKLEGLQKKWHNNGILKGEWYYSDDKLNGIIKEWYPNKQLKFSKKYISGELIEVLEHYNPDGTIVQ